MPGQVFKILKLVVEHQLNYCVDIQLPILKLMSFLNINPNIEY